MVTALQPRLEPGQITHLFIWVHPAWSIPYSSEEEQAHREFFQDMKGIPHAGLIQVPDCPAYFDADYEEFLQGNAPYKPPGWVEAQRKWATELAALNDEAKDLLGDRYQIWVMRDRFIRCTERDKSAPPRHLDELVRLFQLRPFSEEQSRQFLQESYGVETTWFTQALGCLSPLYLKEIVVYGKMWDTCALLQATSCGLHTIAARVTHTPSERPPRKGSQYFDPVWEGEIE